MMLIYTLIWIRAQSEFQIPSDVLQLYAFSEEDIHICLKESKGVGKRLNSLRKYLGLEEVYETTGRFVQFC